MKSSSSNAQATTTTKRAAKNSHKGEKAQDGEVVVSEEVIERLKSWCYV